MDHRPADAVAGQEAAPLAHRQRGLVRGVAEGDRVAGEVLEELALDGVAPLVEVVLEEVGEGVPVGAALQRHHLEAGVLAQLVGDRAADEPEPDHHDVDLRQRRHR